MLALVRLYEPFFVFLIKQFVKRCFGIVLSQDPEGIKTQTLSTFLASSLNVELVHIILKGIKKFSNIRMSDPEPIDIDESRDARQYREQQEKESYELMRICRLNRIKIKNPEKWDKAKYDDFVENAYIGTDKKKAQQPIEVESEVGMDEDGSANQTMLTINEEVTIFEYAPQKF